MHLLCKSTFCVLLPLILVTFMAWCYVDNLYFKEGGMKLRKNKYTNESISSEKQIRNRIQLQGLTSLKEDRSQPVGTEDVTDSGMTQVVIANLSHFSGVGAMFAERDQKQSNGSLNFNHQSDPNLFILCTFLLGSSFLTMCIQVSGTICAALMVNILLLYSCFILGVCITMLSELTFPIYAWPLQKCL